MVAFNSPSYFRIFMGEAIIHSEGTSELILATNGLRSCIGFSGWEPTKKIGFLVHFAHSKQVADFYTRGISILSDKTCGIFSIFHCVVKGGSEKYPASGEIFDAIKKGLTSHESTQFKIADRSPFSKADELQSISLSIPEGVIGDYDETADPNPRQKTEDEIKRDVTFSVYNELHYRFTHEFSEGFAERKMLPLPPE